ncbi:TPA: trypsin-like serine protease [Candidatus Bathyarchaeota archaeon]|nr:trypsin-like serine protease [Candidatus Bathyarchaeota archaeon]
MWVDAGPIAAVWDDPPGEYPFGGRASFEGTPFTMPGFGYYLTNAGLPGFITRDVGVVVLRERVPRSVVNEYGRLPAVGEVDALRVGMYVDLVGYGVQYQVTPRNDGGPYEAWRGERTRYFAQAQLLSGEFVISDKFLKTSANAAQGKGGTAFGDSGGPVLKVGTDTVLAITSFGSNVNCAGTGYYYRVDQADVLRFINGFVR